jgi:hypothetical protein
LIHQKEISIGRQQDKNSVIYHSPSDSVTWGILFLGGFW